ncbi:MAG: hypothetical protein DMF77_05380 [Acidobacteria bacterium]|nr:MAG: hypothetical protein DMF77_05380 [Acidobacteriota bacterium]
MTGARPATVYAVLLALAVLIFPYWGLGHVPPIQDAANLVARASSRGLELQHLRLREYVAFLRMDVNNLLSVVFFSLASLVVGPGRAAWGWGWAALVGVWFLAARAAEARHPAERPLLASVVFFSFTPLVFRPGGLLDQRFDPAAVLAASAAVFALLVDRPLAAAWLSLLAMLSKGPAVSVVALAWIAAFVTGIQGPGRLVARVRSRPWAWAAVAAASLGYAGLALRDVIAYNLSAIAASTPAAQTSAFFVTAPGRVWKTASFYPSALLLHSPASWLVVASAVGIVVRPPRQRQPDPRRRIFFGLLLLVLVDLVFSATPPPAAVLVVWLAPALFVLCVAVVGALPPLRGRAVLVTVLSTLVLSFQIYGHAVGASGIGPQAAAALPALAADADALAGALRRRPMERHVVIATNVLYAPLPDLAYNCDVLRVLLYERLGRPSPALDGWTLGSWGDDWRAEMEALPADAAYLTLLSVGGRDVVHHRGQAGRIAAEFLALVNPGCAVPVPDLLGRPELGHVRAYLTSADLKSCR